jgi:agmatinase
MQAPETGFLGVPVELDLDRLDADVAILGVPHGWPYPRPGPTVGCAEAPAAVRRRALRLAGFRGHWDFDLDAPMLPADGVRLVDAGDVSSEAADGPGNSAAITSAVATIVERGAVPICLGGDDSVTIPVLRGMASRGPLTVLQVDAHLDFRDEIDGVREGYSSPMRRASEMPHVARVVQVGLRGVGSARLDDRAAALAAGHELVSARELRAAGAPLVLSRIPAEASVFVAFDVDGLDPSAFPAASALAPGGLTFGEADELLAGIGSRLVGAALTEYVPALDVNEMGALTVSRLAVRLASGVGRHHNPSRAVTRHLTPPNGDD